MTTERWVLDSNVLISAALSAKGAPAQLLDAIWEHRGVLIFSSETFSELESRLIGEKFDRYISRLDRVQLLAELDSVAEFVEITGAPMGCRDRDDDLILETALNGDADLIVSGDQDLLVLHPWRAIEILSPAQALSNASKNV